MADPFLDAMAEARDSRAGANVAAAADVPAGNALTAFKNAPDTGEDPNLAMADPMFSTGTATANRNNAALASSPALRDFAARGPAYVAATQNDWGTWAKIGEGLSVFPRGLASGIPAINQGLWGIAATAAGLVGAKDAQAFAQGQTKVAKTIAGDVAGAQKSWLGRQVSGAAQSVGVNAPGLVASLMTGNPVPALATGAAIQGGTSAGEALEKGKSPARAAVYGATDAGFEAIFERIPLVKLLEDLKVGTTFKKMLAKQMASEVATEVPTTLAQNLNEWAQINPEKPLGDFLAEQPKAVADTIAQTIIATGVSVGGIEGVRRGADRIQRKADQKVQAQQAADAVRAISEQIATVKTHKELPQLTQDFLSHTPIGADTVWVNGDTVAELYSQGHTPFKGMESEIETALTAGRDIPMRMDKFLAEVSGQPFADKVFDTSRFTEDGPSVAESAEAESAVPTEAVEPKAEKPPLVEPRTIPEDLADLDVPLRTLAANVEGHVDEIFADQAITELFTDSKALKLSNRSFERYGMMLEEAKAVATEKVLEKVYKQIRAERAPEWKDKIARERAVVEGEIAEDRALVARQELQYSEGPKGEPLDRIVKLSKSETTKGYGADTTAALPASMFAADGLHPDDAAEKLGYSTGEELLADMLDLESARKDGGHRSSRDHLRALVTEETTARARAELGFDLSPEGIAQAAREAAVVPQIEDYLDSTMKEMAAELGGLPFNKAAVQFAAAVEFSRMIVKVGSNVRQFERGMFQTGEKVRKALEKGDWAAAFVARQQQMRNFYQLNMAHELNKRFKRSEKQFARLGRKKTIKGMSQEVLNHIHAYLPRIDVGVSRQPEELVEALAGSTVESFVDDLTAVNPVFPLVPTAEGDQSEMLVGDWRDVREFLTAMARYGREMQSAQARKLTVTTGGTVPLDVLRERAAAGAPPKGPAKPIRAGGRKSPALKAMEAIRGFNAAHRIIDNIAEDMDATDTVFNDTVEDPMQQAADMDAKLRRTILRPFTAAFWRGIPAKVRATYGRKVENHPLTFNGQKIELRRGDILHIAFRVGTQDSLEKFAEGYNTTPEAVLDLLDRNLHPGEVDFVQAGWDAFEALAPHVSGQLRAMRGVGLEKVPAREWTIGDRTMRGGYWPIDYDRELDPAAAEWDNERHVKVGDEMDPGAAVNRFFAQVVPDATFSYARRNHVGPMVINLNGVLRSFDSHIKYAAYARTVASVRRFINDPFIKQLVKDRIGIEKWNQFNPWLDNVVLDYTISDKATSWMENWAKSLRINSTIATLGFSFTTGIAQAGGIPNVLSMIDNNPAKATLAWTQGLAEFNRSLMFGQLEGTIFSKSEFMRQRFGHMEANMAQATDDMHHKFLTNRAQRFERATRDTAMAFIGWTEFLTVTGPGWIGAYNTAVGKGKSLEAAALWADKVIRRSQGSGRKVDLAGIQRGSEFLLFLYRFNSFFIRQYNAGLSAGTAISRGEYGKAFNLGVGFFVVAPMLSALLTALTTSYGPDWEDPEEVAAYFASAVFFGAFRGMFLAGDVANVAAKNIKLEDGEWSFGTPRSWLLSDTPLTQHAKAAVEMGDSILKAVEGEDQNRPYQTWIGGAGLFAGYPTKQPARIIEYGAQVQNGDQTPEDAFDVFKGLVSGPQEDQE